MSSSILFPAPVGGVPLEQDLAPSIVFAALYAVLLSVGSVRGWRKETRNAIQLRLVLGFLVDRMVVFTLRAVYSRNPTLATSHGPTVYMQIAFAIGYINIFTNVSDLLRCLIVGTTIGTSTIQGNSLQVGNTSTSPASSFVEDQPRKRFCYRRHFDFMGLMSLLPIVLGIVAGAMYGKGMTDVNTGNTVQRLRVITSALALGLTAHMQCVAIWALFAFRKINRTALALVILVTSLLLVIPIYHFIAMRDQTSSLLSTAPGSQNTTGDKALFYIFQVAPEFLAAALLTCSDVKTMFGTGLWGDRWNDKEAPTENIAV